MRKTGEGEGEEREGRKVRGQKRKVRGKRESEEEGQAVLWSQSNLDQFRFWLPAPDNNIFVTQIYVKSAVLKTKVNNLVF